MKLWKRKNMSPFEALKTDFPMIFDKDFFFEIKDGWIPLIREMCSELMALPPHSIEKAAQVKSKFGSLRFYPENYSESMQNIIQRYEIKSSYICENCGTGITERENVNYFKSQCVICLVDSA